MVEEEARDHSVEYLGAKRQVLRQRYTEPGRCPSGPSLVSRQSKSLQICVNPNHDSIRGPLLNHQRESGGTAAEVEYSGAGSNVGLSDESALE